MGNNLSLKWGIKKIFYSPFNLAVSLQYLVQRLSIKVNAFVFTDVSVALSPSRKVNLVEGALGVHQCRFRPNSRKSLCHASFQEITLDNLRFPKCSIYALTRAAVVIKEQIT